MKGCIIKNDEISIKDICNIIGDVDNYNWLITNIECYPSDEEIVKILDNEYCWIEGRSLLDLLAKEEFQWIWGVFSAFPKEIRLEEVLKYQKEKNLILSMPGNKSGIGFLRDDIGKEFVNNMGFLDITEVDPLDNLHCPEGIIKEAQDLLAKTYGFSDNRI